MHLRDLIADDLSIPESLIDEAIHVARTHVKIFRIKKRSGGSREIFHPSKKLKTIQYWFIHKVFSRIPIHNASIAYRKGLSILDNADRHRLGRYFLKLDLEEFFPSISFSDFLPILRKWHESDEPKWAIDESAEELIRRVCFYKDDRLAIGYPSSPIISNIVMRAFDSKVSSLIEGEQFGNVIYTRYADDLVFSTDKKGACAKLKKEIIDLVKETTSPNIKVNYNKVRFGSSAGGSASVTGLKVCADGHITIHRRQKDHIRLLLSLYKKGRLNPAEESSLLGHLSYCLHVAPDFYTKVANKYFTEIHELRLKNS